jgi:hypothetical protein
MSERKRKPLENIETIEQLETWLTERTQAEIGNYQSDLLYHVEGIVTRERNDAYREGQWDYECTRDCCYDPW